MSGFFPDLTGRHPAHRDREGGFTLIELMVVLVLLGLITSIALPNLVRLYESVQRRTELDRVITDLNQLGERAFDHGAGFTLSAKNGQFSGVPAELQVSLPSGWRALMPQPVIFYPNGACAGGSLQIMDGDVPVVRAVLRAPRCQLELP